MENATNFDKMTREELIKHCLASNLAKGRDLHFGLKKDILALCKGEIIQLPKIEDSKKENAPAFVPNPQDLMSVENEDDFIVSKNALNEDNAKHEVERFVKWFTGNK